MKLLKALSNVTRLRQGARISVWSSLITIAKSLRECQLVRRHVTMRSMTLQKSVLTPTRYLEMDVMINAWWNEDGYVQMVTVHWSVVTDFV